jgi:hypothetical protein
MPRQSLRGSSVSRDSSGRLKTSSQGCLYHEEHEDHTKNVKKKKREMEEERDDDIKQRMDLKGRKNCKRMSQGNLFVLFVPPLCSS